jgi:hypothetical protein
MANKFLFLRAENSPFVGNAADITKNSVLSHSNVDNNFIFLKGEDVLTGSTAGNKLILNKVNSDKITIDLSSISSSITAANGLSVLSNVVELGGTLNKNTIIDLNTNTFEFTGGSLIYRDAGTGLSPSFNFGNGNGQYGQIGIEYITNQGLNFWTPFGSSAGLKNNIAFIHDTGYFKQRANTTAIGDANLVNNELALHMSGTTLAGRYKNAGGVIADITFAGGGGVTLTNGNGTTASGSAVNLGGTLTSNAIINGGGKNLELGTSANLLNNIKINSQTGSETYSGGSLTNIVSNTPNTFDRKVTDGDAVTLFEAYPSTLDLKSTKPTLSGESRVYVTPQTVEITQTNTSTTKGGRLQITPSNSIYTYTNGTGITSGLLMSSSSVNLTINETGGGNSGLILKPEESLVFTDNASLKLTPSATTFTDGRVTTKGIEYAADYSTGWTANSLVTKSYVDSSSGGTTTLNNGDIFVGNVSNSATSVTMTGDTLISNTGVVTIQPDVVTYDKMQDVTAKSVLGNSTGAGTIAEIPIIEHYLPAGNANIALLNLTTNWDVNGNYTGGTAITLTYQGQSHYNGDYWFTAVADNTWIRLIRG